MLFDHAHHILDAAARVAAALEPVGHEADLRNAAVLGAFSVGVAVALPGIDGRQVRRLQCRHLPLHNGEIGDAGSADLAVAPGLHCRPFDQVVEIAAFILGPERGVSLGIPHAARVGRDVGVAVLGPVKRIGGFESGVLGNPFGLHTAVVLKALIAALGSRFSVGGPGNQRGQRAGGIFGAVDVHVDFDAVAHGHRHVALDHHAVGDLPGVAQGSLEKRVG